MTFPFPPQADSDQQPGDSWLHEDETPQARRPSGRRAGCFLLVGVLLLGGLAWAVTHVSDLLPTPAAPTAAGKPPFYVPVLEPAPRTSIPGPAGQAPAEKAAAPTASGAESYEAWITRVSGDTDIPPRVLKAYVAAEKAQRSSTAKCHITWATLAAVGRIESKHGRHDGSSVDAQGLDTPPVIGPALDGSPGFQAVEDTDKGALDGDVTWDHAVGPMQFLPDTWRRQGVRASGDGAKPDPQNIDDAARTTARYLCNRGGDLGTPAGWWTAVLTYNASVSYGQEVFSNADAYGKVALGQP
ncbi:lytic transglycosylase domain-containing protein [Amycolatopsis sp. H20-H5]|uniref:lytic transglycosylase domain-containing protein n=1 Tax=Amycolatopsis sp. H20-H5 TaxID=3046309 RepID=UPI002DB57984|nr:lytic murein transglycosylase [Amycolatopsis sp. H20-H5]MEC3977346.1 lytic murein transglycosylase [Amycolatopsis sp. H20-H5]